MGLLGLIGIAVLILIYLLKPNYQRAMVSSTFVWKLSLKYRRKKIPVSKLRNILLFICQVLVITACAIIFAEPFIPKDYANNHEKVVVIDASASMRASVEGETRFERAIEQVKAFVEETYKNEDGKMTIILSSDDPYFLTQRTTVADKLSVLDSLDALVEDGELACSYAPGDPDKAFELANQVITANPNAELFYYTGTKQLPTRGKTQIVSVADEGEWNVAILEAKAVLRDNKYTFAIDVASYGRDSNVAVYCDVTVPGKTEPVRLEYLGVSCTGEETKSIVIDPALHNENPEITTPITAYASARVYLLGVEDSFYYDNEFYIYGGVAPELKIQYASNKNNIFANGTLASLREATRQRWNIDVDECAQDEVTGRWDIEPAMSGYDVYVFENLVPEESLPTDGVVILLNPGVAPESSSFVVGGTVTTGSYLFSLSAGEDPANILQYVTPGNIFVSQYQRIEAYDGYTPVMKIGDDPAALIRNTKDEKVLILTFSVNFSIPIAPDYPLFLYSAFNYLIPSSVTNGEGMADFAFDVNEEVTLNSRADTLNVSGPLWEGMQYITEFPAKIKLTKPGTYSASQLLLSNKMGEEKFFVKICASESHITRTADELPVIEEKVQEDIKNYDLILYFAIALVVLSALEWFLHSQERV